MRRTTIFFVALIAAILGAAFGRAALSAEGAEPAVRLVIVSWDGAADWVVDRLLEEGRLPHFQALADRGVHAEHLVPANPSKTAPGHAALWTGTYSDRNGVTGNAVPRRPRAAHTLLEFQDGFTSAVLDAEPLWLTALLAGRRVVSLAATHMTPAAPYLDAMDAAGIPSDRFVSFDGFRTPIAPAEVLTVEPWEPPGAWTGLSVDPGRGREVRTRVGDQTFHLLIHDDPDDATAGFDTVTVCSGGRRVTGECATLKPAEGADTTSHWSRPFAVTAGGRFGVVYFRLFSLAPDGSEMVLYRRAATGFQSTAPEPMTRAYLEAAGGFIDDGFAPYRTGRLGRPLWEGGDGAAERRLMEIVRLDAEFRARGIAFALERLAPDLLFHYSSAPDSAGHTWMGVLDPESPAYDAATAELIWPFYAEVFALEDAWLGRIMELSGDDTIVTVVGDHGMTGVARFFYPNRVLEAEGLLARVAGGNRIDLGRTRMLAPPWGEHLLTVNSTDWKEGVVADAEREAVMRAAARAMLDARDPETGEAIVTAVFASAKTSGLGLGGPAGGDLYLELAPGYLPSPALGAGIVADLPESIGAGGHGFHSHRARMQTLWVLAGPGVASGRRIGGARQIDVAPTLSRLLGIPAPRHASGHAIGAVLAER